MDWRSNRWCAPALLVAALLIVADLTACGGGGGGPSPPPAPSSGATTFRGNFARITAMHGHEQAQQPAISLRMPVSFATRANAQDDGVRVCVDGTTFCAVTDADGVFVLVAPVSGNVVLLFTGVDFTARLTLAGIPMGAIVSIRNLECSTSTGRCVPQQMDIEAPTPAGPLPNHAPLCGLASANPAVVFPPNHQMVAVVIADVDDPDGDAVAIAVTGVFQDEPVLGTGSGDTAPDATLDPLAVRAERNGQENGRVYTINFVAADTHGASCAGRVQVCVPHDQRPGSTCGDEGPVFNSTR